MIKMEELKKEIPYVDYLPSHWSIVPNRYLFRYDGMKVGQNFSKYQLLSLTKEGVKEKDINAGGGKVPDSYDNYQTVKKGQMIFCLFDLDCSAVFSGLSSYDGMITSAYDVFTPTDLIDGRYADYWFKYVFTNRYYMLFSKNIRYTVSSEIFNSLKTPVPPKEEQQRIADFLDKKCSQIDKLIKLQENEIEKLKEYKQSIISETIAKDFDSADLIETGMGWIDKIPSHWSIVPIKTLFTFGKGLPITKENLTESGVNVISYGQVHSKTNACVRVDDSLYRFVSEDYLNSNPECLVKKGDFIFADTSEDVAGTGDFVHIDNNVTTFAGYHSIILRNKNKNNSKYLAYQFMTDNWRHQIRSKVSGVKLFSLTKKILGQAMVIIPSKEEQDAVVNKLESKCDKIDKLIEIKKDKIEKLADYKKSLIYECVTGKKEI